MSLASQIASQAVHVQQMGQIADPTPLVPLRDLVANVVKAVAELQHRLAELAGGVNGDVYAAALAELQRLGV